MSETPPTIFFDGVCGMCNRWVDFVIVRDRERVFRYSPLQSDHARATLVPLGIDPGELSSIVLVEGGRAWQRSAAVLRILKRLGGVWSLLGILRVVPGPIRDWVYGLVSKHRYRVFGRSEACRVPTPEERALFVTDGPEEAAPEPA
ncbi:MAG: membrane protein [Phycisphaeraceae bacterium]|nr:MAG: membrane protein [Phycisphaeraceae bacterium]